MAFDAVAQCLGGRSDAWYESAHVVTFDVDYGHCLGHLCTDTGERRATMRAITCGMVMVNSICAMRPPTVCPTVGCGARGRSCLVYLTCTGIFKNLNNVHVGWFSQTLLL